ncbi:MAG TPA: PRC-barrel domain-containing protein [Clostridia bacterium]|nr:PRC-barrel domain-containing protein [Clostridia bacterium]
MKKASEITGLSLMGIKEGISCGAAKDFIIDPQSKRVKSIVVKYERNYDFRELNVADIVGIGKDYIVTQSLAKATKLDLEGVEVSLVGMTCISCFGFVIGNVEDFEFDEYTGEIHSIRIDSGMEIRGHNIISISNAIMFVNIDADGQERQLSDFESEQREFMLGRTVSADIIGQNGSVVIAKGTVVTEDIIRFAEAAGLTVDLTLNLK